MKEIIKKLNFDEKGLIPVVIQDDKTNKVLTLCYMNREALEKTIKEGKVYLFRRSKYLLMLKGETSGHVQLVKSILVDCSYNSLLIKVEQKVGACHMGYFTCYYREIAKDGSVKVVGEKVFDPRKVYKNV